MYKITVISNNRALPYFKEEHGYSILLEKNNYNVLFDTGYGEAFIYNCKKLNVNLDKIDSLIISHGHYDHCGNIKNVANRSKYLTINLHPDSIKSRYSIHEDREPQCKYIGISPENLEALEVTKKALNKTSILISEGIYITGEIPRLSGEDTGGPFFNESLGINKDEILDDQTMWFEEDGKLIIITGCCHAGLINTVEYIKTLTNNCPVKTIIGGLHLNKASKNRVLMTINYLNELNPESIYPGHCTGDHIITKLKKELTCKVNDLFAGMIIKD